MPLYDLRPRFDSSSKSDKTTEYTYKYWGYSNSPTDTMRDILADPLTPRRHARDANDPRARFVSVQAQRAGTSKKIWDITAVSSTEVDEEEQDENPLARPAEYAWRGSLEEIAALTDGKGRPHVNTAGDYFEGATKKRPLAVVQIEKNIPPGGAAWLLTHLGKANKDAIKLDGLRFQAGTLMLTGLSIPKPTRENDVRFRACEIELTHNPDTWVVEHLNRGLREIKGTQTTDKSTGELKTVYKKVEILDDDGKPITEPVFLDKQGRAIRETDDDGRERLKHPIEPSEIITIQGEIERIAFKRKLPLF